MNDHELRRLTGMITLRLWLVLLVVGAVGAGMAWVGIGIGMALLTLAVLILPIAVVATVAFRFTTPRPRPRPLAPLGRHRPHRRRAGVAAHPVGPGRNDRRHHLRRGHLARRRRTHRDRGRRRPAQLRPRACNALHPENLEQGCCSPHPLGVHDLAPSTHAGCPSA
ncbi:hypothetical protein QP028_09615 [Corynebacterium suedekumii]|nr:hypothetical protein QP028_09615 [Corynebacterium suedekumii]